MSRTRKTTLKDLHEPKHTVSGHVRPATAPVAEAPVEAAAALVATADTFDEGDDADTVHRGSHPPQPSTSRRISPTLAKIFQRRRQQIGLSLAQVANLSGVTEEELRRFENTQGQHRLVYDHAIVVARVLGIKPGEMPGLRGKDEAGDPRALLTELERALHGGLLLVYEGVRGERFGGPLERAAVAPAFGLQLADATLGEAWPKGALLAFVSDPHPRAGDVVIVRSRHGKQLALRRLAPPSYLGLAPWQPALPASTGSEWLPLARLHAVLPRG